MLFLSQDGGYKAIPLPNQLQTLNVQDLYIDQEQGTIYYVGGNQELVAVRANAMAAKAGRIAKFDVATETFLEEEWLDLPIDINARNILKLENGSGLVINNNGYPYLVNWLD